MNSGKIAKMAFSGGAMANKGSTAAQGIVDPTIYRAAHTSDIAVLLCCNT